MALLCLPGMVQKIPLLMGVKIVSFTSTIFLFVFFPLFIVLYCVSYYIFDKRKNCHRLSDFIIVAFSFLFYGWASAINLIYLFFYVVALFLEGKLLAFTVKNEIGIPVRYFSRGVEKIKCVNIYKGLLIICICIQLSVLVNFKYSNFIIELANRVPMVNGQIPFRSLQVPLGISFISFSSISYLADIYRGDADGGTFVESLIYIFFFPKVISGPVVLWKDFHLKQKNRCEDISCLAGGISRVIIGFAKKVILADTFGSCLSLMDTGIGVDQITAIGAVFLYAMQIYYDFSGYSDMAIGLAEMVGFKFEDNFKFPYLSTSIGDFWRRWHVSLGRWFREYVYIPLGGNRKGFKRTLINLMAVFLLTGLWHGAGWAYIVWGGIHGLLSVEERRLEKRGILSRIPRIIKWFCTLAVAVVLWELFRFGNIADALHWFKICVGSVKYSHVPYTWKYYFGNKTTFLLAVAFLGAIIPGSRRVVSFYKKIQSNVLIHILQEVFLLALLFISVIFMVNSTYSPFIYFQF